MRLLWVIALLLMLTGCKSGPSPVGKWQAVNPAAMDSRANLYPGKDVVPLELREDHTFSLDEMSGTWSQSGDTVTLAPEKMSGKAMPSDQAKNTPQVHLKIASDGGKLTPLDPNGNETPFAFTR
jgi:hypothetical protein